MRRKGFTLIEILIVIIVLATIASIALAGLNKTKYKTQKNQAIAYLRAIRTTERLCWASGCGTGNAKTYAALANISAINTTLGVEIKLTNWTFAVTSGTSTTFAATATSDVASGSKTIILDQDANWSGTYTPLPSV